jgi:diaminopimelate decarboxylase
MPSSEPNQKEPLPSFLTPEHVRAIREMWGTPIYVYDQKTIEAQADKALAFPNASGLTVRYAMKANSNANILRILHKKGVHIDASSGFEAERAMVAGIPAENILLTSQQVPHNLGELVEAGVQYNACSFYQLECFGDLESRPDEVSVRINPGLGSGGTKRTNTGGPASSFGMWHEGLGAIVDTLKRHKLGVKRVHTHIGSGSDPAVWRTVAGMSLEIVAKFGEKGLQPRILNLGGGFKVGRMVGENSTDLQACGNPVARAFEQYNLGEWGRLHLEIEPGTFLMANAGAVIASVADLKKTPGYEFIITDTGMTDVARPTLYGAQHPITLVTKDRTSRTTNHQYVVSGHCCESGDILTPAPGDPEALQPRTLPEALRGDLVVIGGAGAYCSSMAPHEYNSFPTSPEALIDLRGNTHIIRERQTLAQIIRNEIPVA